MVAVAAGLAVSVPLLSSSLHKLGAQGWFHSGETKGGLIQPATPTPHTTPVTGLLQPPTPAPAPASPHPDAHSHRADANGRRNSAQAHRSPSRGQPARDPAPRPASHARPVSRHRAQPGGLLPAATVRALIRAGVEIAAGIALIGLLLMALVGRRARRRSRREYALYELHLSTHDQAKPQDLEDMVESIANIVRAWPAERIRDGQPYLALELICGHAPHSRAGREMQWSINIRCEPRDVAARWTARSAPPTPTSGSAASTASDPRPRGGRAARAGVRDAVSQGAQLRLLADRRRRRSRRPRRLSRSPAPRSRSARRRSCASSSPRPRRSSRRSRGACTAATRTSSCARSAGDCPRAGCGRRSTAPRCAPPSAPRTAACSGSRPSSPPTPREVCKTVAAAVQSRRGENRLHRRWMIVRQRLYRRRFPRALGPLVPSYAVAWCPRPRSRTCSRSPPRA